MVIAPGTTLPREQSMIWRSLTLTCLVLLVGACAGTTDRRLVAQDASTNGGDLLFPDGPDGSAPDQRLAADGAGDLGPVSPDSALGKFVESITANGRGYNFDVGQNNKPWPKNGFDLLTVPRFAAGPCKGKGALGCKLDTRCFVVNP
jgi:hypothetical protein